MHADSMISFAENVFLSSKNNTKVQRRDIFKGINRSAAKNLEIFRLRRAFFSLIPVTLPQNPLIPVTRQGTPPPPGRDGLTVKADLCARNLRE